MKNQLTLSEKLKRCTLLLALVLLSSAAFPQTSPTIEWQKSLGGTYDDYAYYIQQTTDGGFVVAGNSLSNNGDVSGNHGYYDYWIVKLKFSPGGIEVCNKLDDDCDGSIDEGVLITYYSDNDGDNYGDANNSVSSCAPVSGYVIDNTDCDDNNSSINPSATEICNNLDDNCINGIDDGLIFITYYADTDGDNYGDAGNSIDACAPVSGYITENTDCDDTNADVNPGATEITSNGIDDDCDGYVDEFGVGVSSIDQTENRLSVFPNPTDGKFVIELELSDEITSDATIEVINLLGQVMQSQKTSIVKGKLQEEIQFSNEEAEGMYLVKVTTNEIEFTKQIILQK